MIFLINVISKPPCVSILFWGLHSNYNNNNNNSFLLSFVLCILCITHTCTHARTHPHTHTRTHICDCHWKLYLQQNRRCITLSAIWWYLTYVFVCTAVILPLISYNEFSITFLSYLYLVQCCIIFTVILNFWEPGNLSTW